MVQNMSDLPGGNLQLSIIRVSFGAIFIVKMYQKLTQEQCEKYTQGPVVR